MPCASVVTSRRRVVTEVISAAVCKLRAGAFLRTTLFLFLCHQCCIHMYMLRYVVFCVYSYLASHQTSSSKLFCRRKIANLFQSCTNNFNYGLSGKCLVIFLYILLVARMPQNITGVVHKVKIKQILNCQLSAS